MRPRRATPGWPPTTPNAARTPGCGSAPGMAGIDGLDAGDPVTAEQMRALFGAGLHPAGRAAAAAARRTGPDRRGLSGGDPARGAVQGLRRRRQPVPGRGRQADRRHQRGGRAARRLAGPGGGPGPDPHRGGAGVLPRRARPATRRMPGSWPGTIAKALPAADDSGRRLRPDLLPGEVGVDAVGGRRPARSRRRSSRPTRPPSHDALAFIETARPVHPGRARNGVRQVDVRGLVAAAFTHRDSRAGDPDLHTHVAVANKVQTLDGRWLSHRRPGAVQGQRRRLGDLQHRPGAAPPRPARASGSPNGPTPTRGKRPVREIVGVDPRLEPALVDPPGQHRGPPRRAGRRVPARPRPAADAGGGDAAGPAGHLGDPGRQARTPHPGRAARRLAGRRPPRSSADRDAVASHGRPGAQSDRRAEPGSVDAAWVAATGRPGAGGGGGTPVDLADLARPRRGATPGPRRRRARRAGRRGWSTCSSTRCCNRRSVSLARPDDGIERAGRCCGGPTAPVVYTVAGAELYTSAPDPGRRAAARRHRRPHATDAVVDAAAVELALLEIGRERDHPQRRAGRAGARDGHLRGPAAAGDRARRRREDHRDARPGRRVEPTAAAP